MMLSRTSRILLVVAAAAALAYWLMDRRSDRADVDTDERLAVFDVSAVDGVILTREDATLRFTRADSVWHVIAPVADTAEPAAILTLLDALDRAPVARNLGAADDLVPFGLDPPPLRIVLLAGADTVFSAGFGKRTVDEAWCYARTRSRELLLVPTSIVRAATLPVDAYRNQRVVDFQLRNVHAYRLKTADHVTEWRRGDGGWYADARDGRLEGDSVAVEAVLRRLRGLRIADVLDGDSQPEATLAGSIDLWQADDSLLASVRFHHSQGGRWVATTDGRAGSFVVDGDISDLLAHTTIELRDRRLLQFAGEDAARIDVALPDATGSIVRTGGAWAFPNPALGRVDADAAADFVRALRSLQWTGLPARGRTPDLDSAPFSITVSDRGGTIRDELRAAPRSDGLWYVTSRSSRGVWMIESERLAALADRFTRLRSF